MDEERHCSEVSVKTFMPALYWEKSQDIPGSASLLADNRPSISRPVSFPVAQSDTAPIEAISWLPYTLL